MKVTHVSRPPPNLNSIWEVCESLGRTSLTSFGGNHWATGWLATLCWTTLGWNARGGRAVVHARHPAVIVVKLIYSDFNVPIAPWLNCIKFLAPAKCDVNIHFVTDFLLNSIWPALGQFGRCRYGYIDGGGGCSRLVVADTRPWTRRIRRTSTLRLWRTSSLMSRLWNYFDGPSNGNICGCNIYTFLTSYFISK